MDPSEAIDLSRNALMLCLVLAGPILVVGMAVGLSISILQAVTQLQEQTLSFVPKIVAMAMAAAFFVPWLALRLIEYTRELWGG